MVIVGQATGCPESPERCDRVAARAAKGDDPRQRVDPNACLRWSTMTGRSQRADEGEPSVRFEVWAPQAEPCRRCDCDGRRVRRWRAIRSGTGWWTAEAGRPRDGARYGVPAVGRRPRAARPALAPPAGRPRRAERGRRPRGATPGGAAWPGRALPGAVLYELHIGTYTPEGTFDAAAARLGAPRRAGRHPRRADARLPVPRHGTAGGTRGSSLWAVHEPYGGPDGAEALRRRGARARPRRGPGRGAQPPRPVRQLPARRSARTSPTRHHTPVGRRGQPGRAGLGRGARVPARQRAGLAARLPARRAAAGRGARAAPTRARCTSWRSCPTAVDALAAELGRPLFLIAESDLNDPRTTTPRAERRSRTARPVERRLPPRPAHRADRRVPGLLRRLRRAPRSRRSPRP